MRRLIVLRHAETVATGTPVPDFERTLKESGFTAADAVGEWLAKEGYRPRIVSSPALRAKQTAEAVARHVHAGEIVWEDRIYEADKDRLLDVLADHLEDEEVLMVGHNPGLEGLVQHLAEGTPPHRGLPTAGAVVLDASQGIYEKGCPVLAWTSPEDLAPQGGRTPPS